MGKALDLIRNAPGDPNIWRALIDSRSEIQAAEQIVVDRTQPVAVRLAAVDALDSAYTVLGLPMSPVIGEAMSDPALVEGAIALGKMDVLIPALHALARKGPLRPEWTDAGRRCIEAGARGIHVATLAITLGDYPTAVKLAIIAYEEHLAPLITKNPHDDMVSAWLDAMVSAPEPVRREFFDSFGDRRDSIIALLRPEQRAKLRASSPGK